MPKKKSLNVNPHIYENQKIYKEFKLYTILFIQATLLKFEKSGSKILLLYLNRHTAHNHLVKKRNLEMHTSKRVFLRYMYILLHLQ